MHIFSRVGLALVLLAASSCSTITGSFVAPEIETPTIADSRAFDLGGSIAPRREITHFQDASIRPQTINTDFRQVNDDAQALFGKVGYGFPFPLALMGGLLGADALIDGFWLGAKLQILGDRGWLTSSPFHLSTYVRLGGATGDEEGDRNGEFGPHGFPWESERSSSFAHLGASAGYRFGSGILAFVGAGTGSASTSAEVTQTGGTGSTIGGVFKNSFDGKVQSFGTGVEFSTEVVRMSVGWHRSRYESQNYRVYDSTAMLNLEFQTRKRESSQAATNP